MTREAFDEVARRQDEYIANNDIAPDRRLDRERPHASHPRQARATRTSPYAAEALLRSRRRRRARGSGDLHAGAPSSRATPTIDSSPSTTTSPASSTPTSHRRRADCGCEVTSSSRAASRTRASRRQGLHDHRAVRHGRRRRPPPRRTARSRSRTTSWACPGGLAYGTENGCFANILARSRVRAIETTERAQADHLSGERLSTDRGR